MPTRIENTFAALRASNKKALIPYIMAGDPNPAVTVELMHTLVEQGVDIIELGLPFSDPMADGPTIALAAERALAAGTSTSQAINMVAEFRKTNTTTPIVLMGYLNPVEFMGYEAFAKKAGAAGVDGVLMVDLPPEEATEFARLMSAHAINTIFLLSPTTTEARTEQVLAAGSGYIYYVSLKGVTGSSALNTAEVSAKMQQIKACTELPVCVGFGIRDGATAKACSKDSDGVIVGSELVKQFAQEDAVTAVGNIATKAAELRHALDELIP